MPFAYHRYNLDTSQYLYRAVDSSGQTIDFLLTAKRDAAAALRFFRKAISQHGEPEVVTIDKSGANTAALAALNAGKSKDDAITVRQLAAQGVGEAHAIINRMIGYAPDLHRIWVGTSDPQLIALSHEFPGFYRYARIMGF